MSAPDPADLAHRRALASVSRHAPARACPSCGEDLPPRRLFCTEYCRVAIHRIRRTEADLARLRQRHDAASSSLERHELATQMARLEARRTQRDQRLAERRVALHGEECASAERTEQATG